MTVTETRKKRPSKFVLIVSAVVVLLLVALAAVVLTTVGKQQDLESLAQVKSKQLPALSDARTKLPTAVDAYIAAYKKSFAAEGSDEKAEAASKAELAAFKKAEASARSAVERLTNSRGTGNEEVRDAVDQFEESNVEFIDYMAGLVDSYPSWVSLFGDDASPCQGIFVGGDAADLTERAELLAKAADTCRGATKVLGASKNSSFADYAQRLANRVTQLEADSLVTAKAEQSLADFTAKKNDLVKQVDRATANNASDERLLALADEAEALNEEIKASKAEFDYSGDRYIRTIEEMPTLLGDVFEKHIPAEVKYFDSVLTLRTTVLEKVLADAAV